MGLVGTFFMYAKLVVLAIGQMVVKLLRIGTTRFTVVTQRLLGTPRIDLPNGDQQLLGTECVDDAVQKDFADEWVSMSDEDKWESGGRDLLDENEKRSCEVSGSSTEDELIELSDGEERPTPITSLHSAKRSRFDHPTSTPTKLTSPDSTMMLL